MDHKETELYCSRVRDTVKHMKTFLVIPTIRTLDSLKVWNERGELADLHIIIVADTEENSIPLPAIDCRSIVSYSHHEIETEFPDRHWIFPWKSSAVRSYGLYKAYAAGADVIITIDDDCYPDASDFAATHIDNLSTQLPSDWTPTYPFREAMFTRGFPYFVRDRKEVVINHGIWSGIPDFDGMTQIRHMDQRFNQLPDLLHIIPHGMYFPMSSMNLSFKREITPLMYQLLMGKQKDGTPWNFDRFEDIWCGVIAKKILDHCGLAVTSGSPAVHHNRASNVLQNIQKEAPGIAENETFWQRIRDLSLKSTTPRDAYKEVAAAIGSWESPYFRKLGEAMHIWLDLFR